MPVRWGVVLSVRVDSKSGKELRMAKDIIDLLEEYIPEGKRQNWAKLQSTIDSRRLELLLLKEILLELRKLNQLGQGVYT